jgi:hypothetical protein
MFAALISLNGPERGRLARLLLKSLKIFNQDLHLGPELDTVPYGVGNKILLLLFSAGERVPAVHGLNLFSDHIVEKFEITFHT